MERLNSTKIESTYLSILNIYQEKKIIKNPVLDHLLGEMYFHFTLSSGVGDLLLIMTRRAEV